MPATQTWIGRLSIPVLILLHLSGAVVGAVLFFMLGAIVLVILQVEDKGNSVSVVATFFLVGAILPSLLLWRVRNKSLRAASPRSALEPEFMRTVSPTLSYSEEAQTVQTSTETPSATTSDQPVRHDARNYLRDVAEYNQAQRKAKIKGPNDDEISREELYGPTTSNNFQSFLKPPSTLQKAGGIIGLIGGIFGVLAAVVTLLTGGKASAFDVDNASLVIVSGWAGIFFSFLSIIFAAVTISSESKAPGIFLIICAIAGALLGGTFVAVFMVLALVGGALAAIGTKRGLVTKPLFVQGSLSKSGPGATKIGLTICVTIAILYLLYFSAGSIRYTVCFVGPNSPFCTLMTVIQDDPENVVLKRFKKEGHPK